MSENLPTAPPWDLIAKRNAGIATSAELAAIAQWLAQNAPPVAEGLDQIDITFEDEAAMAAWLRMQQRSKRLATAGTSWVVLHEHTSLSIAAAEVAHFTSRTGRTTLTTLTSQTYAIALTLDELERTVEPLDFFRANQFALVARASIAKTKPLLDGSLLMQLKPSTQQEAVIPKAQVAAFSAWLGRA